MKKCDICLNSRPIVSENGMHMNCTLSPKAALNCLFGTTDNFVSKINRLKIFVSVGMNGREESDIITDINRASENIHSYCNEYFNFTPDKIEIIDNYRCDAPDNESRLWYLGEAIKKLGECNICYFVKGWKNHKGCIIEMEICKAYGIKIIEELE